MNKWKATSESGRQLVRALELQTGDLVALVGGGGKSSLLFACGTAFPGTAIMTTTTRIFSSQSRLAPCLSLNDIAAGQAKGRDRLAEMLAEHRRCLVIGEEQGEKAAGVPPELPAHWLHRPDVDLVVVEADGSRMRPVKAPAAHEPVIPEGTTLLVVVAGIDALHKPVSLVAHRPELVSELTGLQPNDPLTAEALALLLTHPAGGLKGMPAQSRCLVAINKVDSTASAQAGRTLAALIMRSGRVRRVVLLSLRYGRVVETLG